MSKPQYRVFSHATQEEVDASIAQYEASEHAERYVGYITGGRFFAAIPIMQHQIDDCVIEIDWSNL